MRCEKLAGRKVNDRQSGIDEKEHSKQPANTKQEVRNKEMN